MSRALSSGPYRGCHRPAGNEAHARETADAADEHADDLDLGSRVDVAVEALVGGAEIGGDGPRQECARRRDSDADGTELARVAQLQLPHDLHLVGGKTVTRELGPGIPLEALERRAELGVALRAEPPQNHA